MDKEIKIESIDQFNFNILHDLSPSGRRLTENFGISSESSEAPENAGNTAEVKPPVWFPSSKGRSIVWEHITWAAESQRAACNYCSAEFQVKGGTSALLRHLKTIHPAAINFDPENPPPVARRKRKKMEDYTIVTEDAKSYMDNLLEQFLADETVPRALAEPATSHPQQELLRDSQSRTDSEIDEVIRNLRNESAQNGFPEPEPDQALKRLLGIDDGQCEEVIAHAGAMNGLQPDEEKQVSSSSSGPQQAGTKKRKTNEKLGLSSEKVSLSLLSSLRRPPSTSPSSSATVSPVIPMLPLRPPPAAQSAVGPPVSKFNAQALSILDCEAKVLYNQSLHSTIAREEAMAAYYRRKSRKLELEIKKLKRELGEDQVQDE